MSEPVVFNVSLTPDCPDCGGELDTGACYYCDGTDPSCANCGGVGYLYECLECGMVWDKSEVEGAMK